MKCKTCGHTKGQHKIMPKDTSCMFCDCKKYEPTSIEKFQDKRRLNSKIEIHKEVTIETPLIEEKLKITLKEEDIPKFKKWLEKIEKKRLIELLDILKEKIEQI